MTKSWAVLTLAAAVTATSAITIANAQNTGSHRLRLHNNVHCNNKTACIQGSNSGTGAGVSGSAVHGYGVIGGATGGDAGVGGFNADTTFGGSGVYGEGENGYGVYGFSPVSNGYGVVSQGNALVEGEIFTSGSCSSGCTKTRQQVAFAARTSQPTIDDVGEGALREGVAHVALAPDYANAIDNRKPYVVLLTPEGDASLFVANRTASGFDVRQIGGGRSSIAFAYRIVAKPYGVRDERLPFKTVPDAAQMHLRLTAH